MKFKENCRDKQIKFENKIDTDKCSQGSDGDYVDYDSGDESDVFYGDLQNYNETIFEDMSSIAIQLDVDLSLVWSIE